MRSFCSSYLPLIARQLVLESIPELLVQRKLIIHLLIFSAFSLFPWLQFNDYRESLSNYIPIPVPGAPTSGPATTAFSHVLGE